ncbi:MAG: LAGLIDADG family homing endonuclease [Nanoarchaeota archaeon]
MGFENSDLEEQNSKDIFSSGFSKPASELLHSYSLVDRYFTKLGRDPFKYNMHGIPINWVSEDVAVTDDMGKVVFTQGNVKKPESWSSLALKVVASKYFWGDLSKGEREDSIEKIIGRVSRFITRQAVKQKYFNQEDANSLGEEVASICLNQMAVFNSPVWFNVGIQEYHSDAGGVSAYVWDSASNQVIKADKKMDRPQCSACFIQSMDDTMDSIMAVQVAEANLFKAGSGTGTNRSTLRSSKEKLTGGGKSSGPLSFMKGYDAYAGAIKSGGKTRRAAKMEILNVDHPDIIDFIESKQREEKKAWALIEQGYSGGMNGEAYGSVAFQNCNMSVRVPDEFMESVKSDGEWKTRFITTKEISETLRSRDILRKMAEGTHICGDPGMQFDSIINKYHTSKNSGRINASNPCVTGDTKVLMKDGKWLRIDSFVDEESTIITNTGLIGESNIKGSFRTGTKPVYLLTTKSGYEVKLTADHKVFTVNRGFVQACELTKEDYILIPGQEVASIDEPSDKTFYQMLGVYLGDGCGGNIGNTRGIQLTMEKEYEKPILEKFAEYVASNYERITPRNSPATVQLTNTSSKYVITNTKLINKFAQMINFNQQSHEKCLTNALFQLPLGEQKYLLQGLFTADGTVANYGNKSQYVALDSTSLQLLKDVQLLLLGFGVKSKLYTNRRAGKDTALLPDGHGGLKEYNVREVHSLRISRSSRLRFEKSIGFMTESPKALKLKKLNETIDAYNDAPVDPVSSVSYIGIEEVYDLTEPFTHTFVGGGITLHNCSEYMFLDDSACNLASINLMKFLNREGKFDAENFKKVVDRFITSMELLVDGSSYPTQKIAQNSHDFRPLGLGYANLGALLMSFGLPYDSDEGRAVSAAITALMCGQAYKASAKIASIVGPFPRYHENRDSMLEVIRMHREHVKDIEVNKMPYDLRYLVNEAWDAWSDAYELGRQHGFRNSQATVLAPTGCLIGNSLISTNKGLLRLGNLGNKKGAQWQDVSFKVMTDEGPKDATKFYVNGQASTRKITTVSGYEIQGTEKHKIKVLNPLNGTLDWKRFDEVTEGDIIPLAMNTIFGEENEVLLPPIPELHWNTDYKLITPKVMTKELALLIGYFMGDGSLHSKGLRFCVDNKDEDVVNYLKELINNLFNLGVHITQREGYKEVAVHSVPLVMWWDACGFSKLKPPIEHKGKGYTPYIPDAVLHTNDRKVYSAFLKGLFEADGAVGLGNPTICTASKEFAREIRTLLLSLGYPTHTKIDTSGFGNSPIYVLRLKNISYNKNFLDSIGFISGRKLSSIASRSSQTGKRDYVYLSDDIIEETVPSGSIQRDAVLLSLKRHQAIPREVAMRLYQDTKHPQILWALQFFYDKISSNIDGGIQSTYDISVPENVTYTADGFISHNTIAFMMDCDTTGIEPDIALVKYKVLSGGGMLKIVNRSVGLALERLGYDLDEINRILDHINKNDTIEGAPNLKQEHLPIFDCAFKANKGKRSINYKGHVLMMSVCQPYISGAISKTINMPESATVEEIMDAYVFAWERGLKAVAIYRENSKRSQPLNTKKTEGEIAKKEQIVVKESRKPMPQTRKSITHKFEIGEHKGYLTVGLYDDGHPGEIFVNIAKQGSTVRGMIDAWALSMSMNLQYGATVSDLFAKFRHQKFEPSGFVRNSEEKGLLDEKRASIRTASSIVDYIAQFMINTFGNSQLMEIEIPTIEVKDINEEQKDLTAYTSDEGLVCGLCGGPAKRIGNCAIKCNSCNQTQRSGCGE